MKAEVKAGPPLTPRAYGALVERAVFECCRWSVTSYDAPTLCRYPLLIGGTAFSRLARWAEALFREALTAEAEILARPSLVARLGLPLRMVRSLRSPTAPTAPRVLRVDFHPTSGGYRITEANSDVAGGFIEGSGVTALWARAARRRGFGDPAGALASGFLERVGSGARIGLLHLTQYTEDRQVVAYLARRFEQAGLCAVPFDASQLRPGLRAAVGRHETQLDAVFRFFPAEWLVHLPKVTGWSELGASSAVCNPLSAMVTQSKRFPLVWPELTSTMRTWRRLMPETVAPESIRGTRADWVLKPAFGHEGFAVALPGASTERHRRVIERQVERSPAQWVAQRRFEMLPLDTPDGLRFACLGVYVIDGRAAGAYARVGITPLIDDTAQDAVVLEDGR